MNPPDELAPENVLEDVHGYGTVDEPTYRALYAREQKAKARIKKWATPAQEAARQADQLMTAEKTDPSDAVEWLASEVRADRLARQEQHDELMVMLGDISAALSSRAETFGPAAQLVHDRASEAVKNRG